MIDVAAYDLDPEFRAQQERELREKLLAHRRRIQGLVSRIEDRNIENQADILEIQYLEWEVTEILEGLKLEAINNRNRELSSPPSEE